MILFDITSKLLQSMGYSHDQAEVAAGYLYILALATGIYLAVELDPLS